VYPASHQHASDTVDAVVIPVDLGTVVSGHGLLDPEFGGLQNPMPASAHRAPSQ
jgi:hypothetical protein